MADTLGLCEILYTEHEMNCDLNWRLLLAVLIWTVVSLFTAGAQTAPKGGEVPFRNIIVDRDPPLRPHCKTAGDLDGDGFPDILAASSGGGGLFWYAWPNWTKRRIDTGSFSTDMQVGDVDSDGDLDVIIPRQTTGLVWYENPRPKGNPATDPWKLHLIDSHRAHDLEVGDVDGDGRLDVVVRERVTRVILQKSPDRWVAIEVATGGRGGTALGDLDGDGELDIAQNGYWLRAPEDKTQEWKRREIASGWPDDVGVHIADVNQDGRPDVLLAPAETSGRLVWYDAVDIEKEQWKEHVIAEGVSHIHTFKTADVDGDGDLDVVTGEMEQSPQGRITIHFNDGKGLRWRAQVVGRTGTHNLRVADIGNDGDVDIIGANHGNHGGSTPIDLWENLSANPTPALTLHRWQRHVIDADRPWRAVFIFPADLDGDARPDIVTGGWWYRNPDGARGSWQRHTLGEPLRNAILVYDLDRDGAIDVLGTQGKGSEASADFVWARNDGKGNFTLFTNVPQGDGDFLQGVAVVRNRLNAPFRIALSWHKDGKGIQMLTVPIDPVKQTWEWNRISEVSQDEALSVADIGRDVRHDLLLGTKWLRDDGNSWSVHTLNPASGDPDRNRFADVNGDGRFDAVVGFEAINKPGKLAWYEQPSTPTDVWTEHVISAEVIGPMSLDVADMDRDGDVDVVVGEHNYKDPQTAKLLIFENVDGKGSRWKAHVVHTGDEHHDGTIVIDIDGDGDLDIVSIGWSHSTVLLYENKASGR